MKYLDCIELLKLALELLHKEQRAQIPVSKLQEVTTLVTACQRRTTQGEVKTVLSDVVGGVTMIQANTAIQFLPVAMRDALVDGISRALTSVADAAWDYYSENECPEGADELLRTVVEYHLLKGDGCG